MLEVLRVSLLVEVQRVLDGWALPPVLRACRPSRSCDFHTHFCDIVVGHMMGVPS